VTADIVGVLASLGILLVSGDQFVVGAARLAAAMRVRPSVVGAVIGGLGASLPELVVSSVASVRHSPQIAIGNLVGSIVANVSLALALAALIAPVRVDSRIVRREALLSVGSVLLFAVLLLDGLRVWEGMIALVALGVVLGAMLANAGVGAPRDELSVEVRRFFGRPTGRVPIADAVRSVGGLALMVIGAEILVRSASHLAEQAGIDEGFVGLTVVAVGTSAPLVAIAAQAARRGNHDLVVGSVLGSNMFIALAGGALIGLLHGGVGAPLDPVALWLMAGVVLASWALMARGSLLTRWEAGVLFAAYVVALPFLAR
jgi:cation:H+ antiporter